MDRRSTALVQSHTLDTAAQEIAAMVLADQRLRAGLKAEQEVLRISFLKTLHWVRGLWDFLEVGRGVFTPEQIQKIVARTLRKIAENAIPPRRKRSCPRAVRQPVSSRPRLTRSTYHHGPVQYEIQPVYTQ